MSFRNIHVTAAISLAVSALYPAHCAQAQVSPPNPGRAAVLSNAEQDQRTRQQQEARERAATVQAPAIRAEEIAAAEFPTLPTESPCFRIEHFLLEVPKDHFDLTGFLLRLHSEIFLGLPGELTMGVMALTFVLSLVSGALVYGPFMRRLEFGTYRRDGPERTRWFDLHNLLGIVTLTWALVVGATGVMNALSTPLFGLWRAQTLPKECFPRTPP